MKISSVRIQGMHNVKDKTYVLNQINYLYGLNGSGKTTLMQAVQLALLGYIPGTDKNKSSIFNHANNPRMVVTVNIEDGGQGIQITRMWERTSKEITSTVKVTPELCDVSAILGQLELPVCNFNEFISMTSNKMKDWFMKFLPPSNGEIDWDAELMRPLSEYGGILDASFVQEMKDYAKSLPSGLEGVRQMNEYLKLTLSVKKADLSRTSSTIQSLVYYDDCEDGLDPSQIQASIQEKKKDRDKLLHNKGTVDRNAQILSTIALLNIQYDSMEVDPDYISAVERLSSLSEEVAEPDLSDKHDEIDRLNWQLTRLTEDKNSKWSAIEERKKVINGQGVCPYTDCSCTEITNLVKQYEADIQILSDEVTKIVEEITKTRSKILDLKSECSKETSNYQSTLKLTQKAIADASKCVQDITLRYSKFNSLKSTIDTSVSDLTSSGISEMVAEIDSDLESLHDTVSKIEANKKYKELYDMLTVQRYQIDQDIDILKDWIKITDVNGLQSRLMDSPFISLGEDVTNYIQEFFGDSNIVALFNLSGKANSFNFGISTNGVYRQFDLLSSGEKCLFTFALLLSIIQISKSALPILLVDDIVDHLDDNAIERLFSVLIGIKDVQVLVAGVKNVQDTEENKFVIEVE